MRVLYVVHGFPPRVFTGTESYTYQTSLRVSAEHPVGVFYLFKDRALPIYAREKAERNGLALYGINFDVVTQAKNFRRTYYNPPVSAAFRDCIKQFRPDIVHFTYILGGLSADQAQIARRHGAKVVITLTDFLPLCLRGQLLDYRNEICSGPETSLKCSNCVWMVKRIRGGILEKVRLKLLKSAPLANIAKRVIAGMIADRQRAVRDAISAADCVITPTKALAGLYRRWMPHIGETRPLGYGIDGSLFKDFRRKRGKKIRFGFIGQTLPHKGLHIMTAAAKKLPAGKCNLVVFGGTDLHGSEEYIASFRDDLKRENISWRGTFPYEKIAEAFAQFDVLVVPSLWRENSPLVVLYAKQTHTPMIVADFGGLTEFVRDGATGLVVPPGDSDALAGAMRRFIKEPDLCRRMSENISAPMSIDDHVCVLLHIYRELLG